MRLTFQFSGHHVDACEVRAVREGIQRPCGSEQSKHRQRCQGVQVSDGLGGQVQLRDFGRMASGNSRILVSLRFRVVKLTKALKPEKSAQKRVQVSAQASDIRIFSLTASTVSASSWRFRGRGARARTSEATAVLAVEHLEIFTLHEHIKRSCIGRHG